MNLTHIIAFSVLSLLFGGLTLVAGERVRRAKPWVMLVVSVFAVYWLQSSTPVRNLDFWLPTASLGLTLIVWVAISVGPSKVPAKIAWPETWITLGVMGAIVLLIALSRYTPLLITPSRPPDPLAVLIGLALIAALASGAGFAFRRDAHVLNLLIVFILALFVVLKLDVLARGASAGLRVLTGQAADQASALDIRWLGFSYLAFRLIHVLRDRVTGRLAPGALSLREFVSYVVFFPAFTAGPIDRADRFVKDVRNPATPAASDMVEGAWRILLGVFKKFALADTLALIALNEVNAAQSSSPWWTWVLVYGYAFRIFFDFSGYTDIAIGLGRFFGVKLPENFDQPYLKPNLTLFWNSWHMTLSQWFRAYFFNPLTRSLRTRKFAGGKTLSPTVIILTGQIGTMLLIGLWHGVTWNFIAWGVWHAAGLFVHNRWTEFSRRRAAQTDASAQPSPVRQRILGVVNVLLTFHFVALGWVWFALPSLDLSLGVFRKLLGFGG
jgi:D-alanyl-lipoteichoic acid acyltransferase DltB (MBOAT superfamily)